MYHIAFVLMSLVLLTSTAFSQENDALTETQIGALIDQLANRSSPRKFNRPFERLSKDERKSLEPVVDAFQRLTQNFRASLPNLIEHLDDKRYAAWLISELESDSKWDTLFAQSPDILADLAKKALAEHACGVTEDWKTN